MDRSRWVAYPPSVCRGQDHAKQCYRSAGMTTNLGWVVLKFGGTSVATAERWATIAARVERRLAEGRRPLVVCSALSGISSALEEMLGLAAAGRHESALAAIRERHLRLGGALGLPAAGGRRAGLQELSRPAPPAPPLGEAPPPPHSPALAL